MKIELGTNVVKNLLPALGVRIMLTLLYQNDNALITLKIRCNATYGAI